MARGAICVAIAAVLGCSFATSGGGGAGETEGSTSGESGGPVPPTTSASPMSTDGDASNGDDGDDGDTTTPPPPPDPTGDASSTTAATSDTTVAASSSEDGATTAALACTSALWVTGDVNVDANQDTDFHARLQSLGVTTTVVENAASQTSDADGHCLVVLSALGAASDVEDKFRDVAVPVLTWEYALYDNMRMVPPGDTTTWGIADPQNDIEIVDASHPMAGGMAGFVAIFSGGGRISWGMPAGDVQVVATLPDDDTRATLFGFESGANMADGFVAPARRVGFPGGQTTMPGTTQAVDLFEAAVLWALDEP